MKINHTRFKEILEAKRAGKVPPPPNRPPLPAPVMEAQTPPYVPPHPLSDRWSVLGIKLAPSRNKYFVGCITPYFVLIRESGNAIKRNRHILEAYKIPSGARTIAEITHPSNKPFYRDFTPPFMFHAPSEAFPAIQSAIQQITES